MVHLLRAFRVTLAQDYTLHPKNSFLINTHALLKSTKFIARGIKIMAFLGVLAAVIVALLTAVLFVFVTYTVYLVIVHAHTTTKGSLVSRCYC